MKFSGLTIVARRPRRSRATYPPAKPPPMMRTSRSSTLCSMVQVSVIGSGLEHEERAEAVGRLLAGGGATVVTGGLGEVMAAAARGAKSAGGTTIGILPGETRGDGNPWLDHVVVTGIGHGRNLAVAASGDAVIAIGGRYGTLAALGFALTLGRPVGVLEPGWQVEGTRRARTPEEAVEFALETARA